MKYLNDNLVLVTIQNLYFAPPEKGAVRLVLERWPSGLRRTLGKRVNLKRVSRVRIPLSPRSSKFDVFELIITKNTI